MQRLLPALVAFTLVLAGLGAGIAWLASRDGSSIQSAEATTASPRVAAGPYGLPAGNVVVTYSRQPDRMRIDQLAERLGAIDTTGTRAAGQALVSKSQPGPVTATNGVDELQVPEATDPELEAFVLARLGRTTP